MTLLYSFHPLADRKQDEIWFYTYEKWGIDQADKYIDQMHAALSRIALDTKHPSIRVLPSMPSVFFIRVNKHYVFFKLAAEALPEKIQVLTILHESMDIPQRVAEDLKVIGA